MIILAILKVLLFIPMKLLSLLPEHDFSFTAPDVSFITTGIQTIYYFFPKNYLMPLILIIIGKATFNGVKNFIEYVKSWIPTM